MKTRKGSGKCDETEEFNTWRRGKPATVAKSDWEPVTGVTLEIDIDFGRSQGRAGAPWDTPHYPTPTFVLGE
jgi:hypothetical protein